MILSIDHGNKSIKTQSQVFTSGLIESETRPAMSGDCIYWDGHYYSLTEKRIAYLRDKTEDQRFFVLTLFAIAYELRGRGIAASSVPIDLTLLVGLPPAHYGQLHTRFENYFKRGGELVNFQFNDQDYAVRINKVLSYPQALAAAVTKYGELKNFAISYIIDIGGFTVDVLKLRHGKPDLEIVESFEKGVITLYNSIISECNSTYDRLLEDADIDEVIKGEPTILPGEIQMLIKRSANDFLSEFYNFLRERGIDVRTSKCVFAGGGSILLRSTIERGGKVGFPVFIEDINANAKGYELLYRSEVSRHAG